MGDSLKGVVAGIVVVVLAILQSAIAWRIGISGVSPNLVLLFTISWALLEGPRGGVLISLVGGILLDAFSGARFGLNTLTLVLVSYLGSMGGLNLFRTARFLPYLTILAATLAYNLLMMAMFNLSGRTVIWGLTLWRVVLPAMLVNTLVMPIIYGLASWLHRRLSPPKAEWQ